MSRRQLRTLSLATAVVAEELESRRLRAAALGPDGGLTLTLTAGDDVVLIHRDDATTLTIEINGTPQTFDYTQVTRIAGDGGPGNDRIEIQSSISPSTARRR